MINLGSSFAILTSLHSSNPCFFKTNDLLLFSVTPPPLIFYELCMPSWYSPLCTESFFSSLYVCNMGDLIDSHASFTICMFLSDTFISLSWGQRFLFTTNWSFAFGCCKGGISNLVYSKPHLIFSSKALFCSTHYHPLIPVGKSDSSFPQSSFLLGIHWAPSLLLYVSVIHLLPAIPVGLSQIRPPVSLSWIILF